MSTEHVEDNTDNTEIEEHNTSLDISSTNIKSPEKNDKLPKIKLKKKGATVEIVDEDIQKAKLINHAAARAANLAKGRAKLAEKKNN
jgi:hypothetical protein